MALIANLAVGLTATTGRFTQNMSKAGKSVRGFGSTAAAVAKRVGMLGAAIGGIAAGVAGGGLALLIKGQFEAMDATSKLADRLGISTEKLVGLQHAANLAGVSTDQLRIAMGFLSKSLGRPTAEVTQALSAINLGVKDLIGLSPAAQLDKIADSMKNLATQEQKAAVASKIFGDSGMLMVNMLQQGSAGLAAMQKDAEALGMTFSRLDGIKIEMANDAFTRLRGAMTGVVRQMTIALAPAVRIAADAFTGLFKSGTINAESIGKAFRELGNIIADVFDGVGKVIDGVLRSASVTLRTLGTIRQYSTLGLDPAGQKVIFDNAERIDRLIGQRQSQRDLGQGLGGDIRSRFAGIEADARAAAAQIESEANRRQQVQQYGSMVTEALVSGFKKASPYLEMIFRSQAEVGAALSGETADRMHNAMSARYDMLTDFEFGQNLDKARGTPSSIERAAAAGTRGTYSAELSGRLGGAVTLQQKMLDATERTADGIDALNDNINQGLPAG